MTNVHIGKWEYQYMDIDILAFKFLNHSNIPYRLDMVVKTDNPQSQEKIQRHHNDELVKNC